MKFLVIILLVFLVSCSTSNSSFNRDKVCSDKALNYLKNPRNKFKKYSYTPKLLQKISETSRSMQLCYEEFRERTGEDEFNTCMVVGVNERGRLEFYNFGSKEVPLDSTFLKCAESVTKTIPYSQYGKNFILVQSYQFYVDL